jgi:Raf kinase inhibitor-like YbhB/YbcL family protein
VNIKPIAAKGAFAGALSLCLLGVGGGNANAANITITSPDFPNGGTIKQRSLCKELGGQEIPPGLAWSAPTDGGNLALVMNDLDAGGFIHWIVIGIPPGPGSSAAGQTPGGGVVEPNGNGDRTYRGPCPPAGTGTHRYVFTLYQVPANLSLQSNNAAEESQAIAQASTAQAQVTGTFTAGASGSFGGR